MKGILREMMEREWAIRHLVDAADALNGILVDPRARDALTKDERAALVKVEQSCSRAAQVLVQQRIAALDATSEGS